MNPTIIYLITQLDSFHFVLQLILIITLIKLSISFLIYANVPDEEIKIEKPFRKPVILIITTLLLHIIVPTTMQAAAIWGLPYLFNK